MKIFVYGTLKERYNNHRLISKYVVGVKPAFIIGRLFLLEAGYPVVVTPRQLNLADGTANFIADAKKSDKTYKMNTFSVNKPYYKVLGEQFEFDNADAKSVLTILDRLEGYVYSKELNYYDRVLTYIKEIGNTNTINLGWIYTTTSDFTGYELKNGVWPTKDKPEFKEYSISELI